jgi:polysaccharide biosynthesis/export protein
MKKKILLIILLLFLILQSCSTKKEMLYLQDINTYSNSALTYQTTKIQPNDILKIDVSDLNPAVAAPFNINSAASESTSVEMMKLTGYLVTPAGTITMPILNEINVLGLSPSDVEIKIKDRLIKEGYLINPTVQVRVLNNKFTILGEVRSPGVFPFTEESITLLDAIGLAGDLTFSAIRKDVKLIRELDGKRLVYHIDLTTASWMSNPDYRIRQNDVIIIMPNKLKVNSGDLIKDPIQVLGLVASLLAVILLITNN